nr:type II toxin-antitoxin system HigB family toxin [Halomonas chromatireducens]
MAWIRFVGTHAQYD